LHTRSHGEAFLAILKNRIRAGLFLFDEPEAALSPQRQLALLAHIAELASQGRSQFIMATHSPVLMTIPGATILSFDGSPVAPIRLEDTSHYQITKGILQNHASYWKHLIQATPDADSTADSRRKANQTRRSSRFGSR
jgi:predicted ATPase